MDNSYHLTDLDITKLVDVIPNRDPETSVRFSLPIPNWLDEDSNPTVQHKNIQYMDKKGAWRFKFYNYEDDCEQAVKIDGGGSIIFMSPTPAQSEKLVSIVNSCTDDLATLKPEQLQAILDRSYKEIGLHDLYNENISTLHKRMEQHNSSKYSNPDFGPFITKSTVSSCIYLTNSGIFMDGPATTPQRFSNGAFIFFPEQSSNQVKKTLNKLRTNEDTSNISVKLVQKTVFLKTRRDLDTLPIDIQDIPSQHAPKKQIHKPRPISGFPELTPEFQNIQNRWISTIKSTFEKYGFTNIETPSVEEIPVLMAKGGDADKEIYSITRLNQREDNNNQPKIALHYDLTVPMARYVAQHFSALDFPFKRYQIQKAWRGERPQNGRFREFYQCDIDVVDQGDLSLEFDAEMPVILYNLVKDLNIGNVEINVNNRKILEGFYQGLGLKHEQIIEVIRAVDKIDKIGADGVTTILSEDLSLPIEIIEKCISLSGIKEHDTSFAQKVLDLGVDTPLLREGLEELIFVMERMEDIPEQCISANMSIARGFDYYTGTVYEGKFTDYPNYPTILAGGRYSNLVSSYMNKSLPGVGISLGLTRIFSKLMEEGLIEGGLKTPTQVLVVNTDSDNRKEARSIADALRAKGVNTEVYHEASKHKKQLSYANKKGIPYVLFPQENGAIEIKDMESGQQNTVDLNKWLPK